MLLLSVISALQKLIMYKSLVILVSLVISSTAIAQNEATQLKLLSGTLDVENSISNKTLNNISELNPFTGVAATSNFINRDQSAELESLGFFVGDYIGSNTYYVTINKTIDQSELSIFGIIGLSSIPAKMKFEPSISDFSSLPEHIVFGESVRVNTVVFSKLSNDAILSGLNSVGAKVLRYSASAMSYRIEIPKSNLNELAQLNSVLFIEPIDELGHPENYKARNAARIGGLTKSFTGLNKELDGEGVSVMLQDDGFIGPHLDYAGRIGKQYITTNTGDHGDHVGGTIMGAGNLDPSAQGMAPGATIYVYGAASEGYPGFDSIASHYVKHDIKITSTSYSNGQNAGYTSFARELDIQTENMSSLLHVFSAGNAGRNGWYSITGGHKVAKNVLTVANLTYLDEWTNSSSRGPSRDGRIKPEISAVGTQVWSTTDVNDYVFKTGTSMSCPGVSGTMAVLYQGFKEKNSNNYPEAILMKAIACNTADDLGRPGPDFKFGYGRINARKAYEVINEQTHFSGTITNGVIDTHQIVIPNNKKLAKIMLAWNDPRGAVNASTPLVNNLDLELVAPSSQIVLPFVLDISSNATLDNPATTGVDNINNMEQIAISNMPGGNYEIVVKGSAIAQGPQKYHVIYYLEDEGIELEYPTGGESFVPGEQEVIRWSTPDSQSSFLLEYSLDSGKTWSNISSNVPATDRFYEWTVPTAFTGNAMVRVSSSGNVAFSNRFTISPQPTGVNITRICPDSMELIWTPISGASNYNIYTMGAKYMEIVGTQTASPYIFKGLNYNPYKEMHFAMDAETPHGTKSRRTKSVIKAPGLLNCPLNADIEITNIAKGAGSVVSCESSSTSKEIEIEIKNNESLLFSNVDVYFQVNGGGVVKETYAGVLSAGQTISYKFNAKANYTQGANTLTVWMVDSRDQNRFNDTIVANVQVYLDPQEKLPCYTYDFDHLSSCGSENDCDATTCSLDEGWINGVNGSEDDIDWRVNSAGTPTNSTGPFVDHTLGNGSGKYIFLEASGGCNNQEAALISPCIDLKNATQPKLNYWYHMNGSDMGALHVDIFKNNTWINDVTPVVSGNKGTQWLNNEIDLSADIGSVIRVRFRGVTGGGFRSDMALDDITFKDKAKAEISYVHKGNGLIEFQSETPGGNDWYWFFGNGTTSTIENPTVQFSGNGTQTAYMRVVSLCGRDSVEIEFDIEAASITELNSSEKVEVFPIPATDQLTVKWNKSEIEVTSISLQDMNGKTVLNPSTEIKEEQCDFGVSKLDRGVYFIQLKHSSGIVNKKVVIQ